MMSESGPAPPVVAAAMVHMYSVDGISSSMVIPSVGLRANLRASSPSTVQAST